MTIQGTKSAASKIRDPATRVAVEELQDRIRSIKGIFDAILSISPGLGRVVIKAPVAVPDIKIDPTTKTRHAQPGELVRDGNVIYLVTDVVERETTELSKVQAGALDASDIGNDSTVSGTTVKDAFEQLDADLGDAVLKTPIGAQVITDKGANPLDVTSDYDSNFWTKALRILKGSLCIANYDGNQSTTQYTGNPGADTSHDGSLFQIYVKRITGGVGGYTLNLMTPDGRDIRLDNQAIARQASAPATNGTAGFLWIDTSGASDVLNVLLDSAWQPILGG